MRTTKIEMHCPWCGRHMDRVSCVNANAKPKKDDMTLCFGCGEWCVFGIGLHLRKPTDEEFDIIGTDPDMMKARWAWVEAKKLIEKEEVKREAYRREEKMAKLWKDDELYES